MDDAISIIGVIVICMIGLVLLIMGIGLIHLNFDADGTHTGYVTAVERSGIFVKNYVVYFKTNKAQSQEDRYCVHQEDTQLAEGLRKSGENDKEITITYTGESGLGYHICYSDKITGFSFK
ncbi:MAG: hypothetical protein KGI72_05195 [Patescibacteria group bacterium]|nr:hypothetical protein [Patescibacteria group bacterium]MDE2015888.1 hypothetical protein [Patescibacteria group bacterium]